MELNKVCGEDKTGKLKSLQNCPVFWFVSDSNGHLVGYNLKKMFSGWKHLKVNTEFQEIHHARTSSRRRKIIFAVRLN